MKNSSPDKVNCLTRSIDENDLGMDAINWSIIRGGHYVPDSLRKEETGENSFEDCCDEYCNILGV